MENKKSSYIFLSLLTLCTLCSHKSFASTGTLHHPLYIGVTGGYGSTTWEGLVPSEKDQNIAMNLSTPTEVTEGGNVWGFFGGYEFNPFFALETSYTQYKDARVGFESISLFSFLNNGLTEFTTHTETVNLMGKLMIFIPNTEFRAYSSFGAAGVHRRDVLCDQWRLSPTFGIGLNHDLTPHVMGEIGANYTAGYGEAQLNPTDVYFPFLYSVFIRLAYRI